ncbi:hypothetical protein ACWDSD_39320 [Streptomyces spiralis]
MLTTVPLAGTGGEPDEVCGSLKELLAPEWQAVRQRGDVGELRSQVAAVQKNAPVSRRSCS